MAGPGCMNAVEQFGHTPQAFKQDVSRSRYTSALPGFNDANGTQGQQADHGAHLEPLCTAIRTPQNVVVESVFLIPHTFGPRLIHGASDPKEMGNELDGHLFVERVVGGKLDADLRHVLAEKGYPGGAVCLLQVATGRQICAAVEDADIVQPEETAFKEVLAKAIFSVHPPTEVKHQLGEASLEELDVAFPFERLLRAVKEDRRPGMDWRIDVAEVPLVGRNLTGWMNEVFPQHQIELVFCEIRIDCGERDGMERKVPGRIPRILPLVWHRNDMLVHHVEPFAVPRGACGRLHRILAMFRKPFVQVEEEILLAPQHSG